MEASKEKRETKTKKKPATKVVRKVVDTAVPKETKQKQVRSISQLFSPEGRFVVVPQIEIPFNHVMTSTHLINTDHSKLVMSNKDMSLRQVVVAAGVNAWCKVGDWVEIKPDSFPFVDEPGKNDVGTIRKVKPPIHKFNKTDYLLMTDRAIKWVILKEEM